jgi:hypothetical protein
MGMGFLTRTAAEGVTAAAAGAGVKRRAEEAGMGRY